MTGLVTRLRTLRADFRNAYAAREAELRTALLPGAEQVESARRARHRADGPTTAKTEPEEDEPLYTFF